MKRTALRVLHASVLLGALWAEAYVLLGRREPLISIGGDLWVAVTGIATLLLVPATWWLGPTVVGRQQEKSSARERRTQTLEATRTTITAALLPTVHELRALARELQLAKADLTVLRPLYVRVAEAAERQAEQLQPVALDLTRVDDAWVHDRLELICEHLVGIIEWSSASAVADAVTAISNATSHELCDFLDALNELTIELDIACRAAAGTALSPPASGHNRQAQTALRQARVMRRQITTTAPSTEEATGPRSPRRFAGMRMSPGGPRRRGSRSGRRDEP